MQIDWSIKIGDILTSLTIVVSVIALLISWQKDRNTIETEQANLVRAAAGRAITQLDRWQSLNLSLYQELQPTFVETSEMLNKKYDVIKARDYLWKSINDTRNKITGKILDEQISTSYVNLLAYFPETRNRFLDTFNSLNELEEKTSDKFIVSSQQDVLAFDGKQSTYTSAMLGNALRVTAVRHKEELRNKSTEIIEPVKEFLFNIIAKTNRDILNARQ